MYRPGCVFQGDNLGVWLAIALMPAFGDNFFAAGDDTTYERIGLNIASAAGCELESSRHVTAVEGFLFHFEVNRRCLRKTRAKRKGSRGLPHEYSIYARRLAEEGSQLFGCLAFYSMPGIHSLDSFPPSAGADEPSLPGVQMPADAGSAPAATGCWAVS